MGMLGRVQLVARQACEVFNERRTCKKMKNKTNTSSSSLSPKENSIYNGKGAHWAAFSENGRLLSEEDERSFWISSTVTEKASERNMKTNMCPEEELKWTCHLVTCPLQIAK